MRTAELVTLSMRELDRLIARQALRACVQAGVRGPATGNWMKDWRSGR